MDDKVQILDELRKIRTPIIYDAVEKFNLRPRTEGYMDSSVRCILPSLGAVIGYAATGRIAGEIPRACSEKAIEFREVWEYAERSKHPGIIVVQDMDQPPGKACAWGDVAAATFLSLGFVGTVTNGGVRDIDEVEKLGFHLFAESAVVGHSYVRFTEIGTPVKVGKLVVYPGDLIHADKHGVIVIPKEIDLSELLKHAIEFMESEGKVICYCKNSEFSVGGICKQMDDHDKRVGAHFK